MSSCRLGMMNTKMGAAVLDITEITGEQLYTITEAARFLGSSEQTLRSYGRHGLIAPVRNGRRRFFSADDIQWLRCVRELIHVNKFSIEALKKLLTYAPCWELKKCPREHRADCARSGDSVLPCVRRITRDRVPSRELSTAGAS